MARAPSRPRAPTFRPTFVLLLFWFALFFFGFSILALLPDLLAALRELPPGEGPLTPDELARAKEAAQRGIEGKLGCLFALATAVTGVLAWFGRLPGLRHHV